MKDTCDYVKNSNTPCEICPKRITMLYMCSLLKEAFDEDPNSKVE